MSFHFAVRKNRNPDIFITGKVYFVDNRNMLKYEDGLVYPMVGGFEATFNMWREYKPVLVTTNDKI